ncbi:MAG: hypothetical protein KKC05_02590, partial [Nanoarchaeota archaeon]|nr:hypothetical protein [Nanoarchaeota archaeon]
KLTSGELSEGDLDSNTIFDNNRDSEVGIHIYHIEKFNFSGKIHEFSLDYLSNIINSLKNNNPSLSVIGFSALCVTTDGIKLFYNKLNFRERDFINTEHIIRKNGNIEVIDSDSQLDIINKMNDGYEYVTRCKMLVSLPGEISIVWSYFK